MKSPNIVHVFIAVVLAVNLALTVYACYDLGLGIVADKALDIATMGGYSRITYLIRLIVGGQAWIL